LNPTDDPGFIAMGEQATNLVNYAQARTIAGADDVKLATDDLVIIGKLKKSLEEKRREWLAPFKERVEAIIVAFKLVSDPLDVADRTNRDKVKAFDMEQKRRAAEAAVINRQKEELAKREAALTGTASTVDLTPVVAPALVRKVQSNIGSFGMSDNWTWEVEDINLVPREFMILDRASVTRRVKAGERRIPGIRIFNEPAVRINQR